MTDPDWEPIMKRASAIVTNRGGRTCHAAIIARELGVPAVVGCGDAMERITDGADVTVSCAEGDTGYIYDGLLPFEKIVTDLDNMPPAPLKIMMNVGNPERAFVWNSSSRARSACTRKPCSTSTTSPKRSRPRSGR
jgi:pyruvate,water dikinase